MIQLLCGMQFGLSKLAQLQPDHALVRRHWSLLDMGKDSVTVSDAVVVRTEWGTAAAPSAVYELILRAGGQVLSSRQAQAGEHSPPAKIHLFMLRPRVKLESK